MQNQLPHIHFKHCVKSTRVILMVWRIQFAPMEAVLLYH